MAQVGIYIYIYIYIRIRYVIHLFSYSILSCMLLCNLQVCKIIFNCNIVIKKLLLNQKNYNKKNDTIAHIQLYIDMII